MSISNHPNQIEINSGDIRKTIQQTGHMAEKLTADRKSSDMLKRHNRISKRKNASMQQYNQKY